MKQYCLISAICYNGTYRNKTTNVCEPCPVGEYQPEDLQEECIKCPAKYSTESAGKNNLTDCKCMSSILNQNYCVTIFLDDTNTVIVSKKLFNLAQIIKLIKLIIRQFIQQF